MAHHEHETTDGNPAGFLNIVAILCLLLAVGALGWFVVSQPEIPPVSDDSFTLEPPAVNEQRLQRERSARYGDPDLSEGKEEIDELMETVKSANEMQFGTPSSKQIHDAQIMTSHGANAVITAVGPDAYMAAGQPMFEKCREGFGKLLADLAAGKLEPEQARQDPGDQYSDYRAWCGKAYPAMEDLGIVSPDGTWRRPEVGPTIFDIMNRFRWAAVLDMRKPPWEQLTQYEYEILTRWRASLDNIDKNKRVTWVIQAAKDLPDFDSHRLLGDLHFQAGDYQLALQEYEKSCKRNRQDAFLHKKCDYLKQKARGTQPASP